MKKVLTAATALGLVTLLSGCALLYPNWGTSEGPSDSQSPSASATATPSETPSESASPSPSVDLKPATVSFIDYGTDGSSVYVIAEVTNVAENGGQCTLNFSSGSTSKTLTVKAEENASSTQCYPIYLPLTGLPKGAAKLTVSYSSPGYSGSSQTVEVTVP